MKRTREERGTDQKRKAEERGTETERKRESWSRERCGIEVEQRGLSR